MWIIVTVLLFGAGLIVGGALSIAVTLYILSTKDEVESNQKEVINQQALSEGEPTEADKKLVSDALKFLRGDDKPEDIEAFPSEEKALGAQQMDSSFGEFSKDARERQKHVRGLHLFFGEYNKLSKSYSRDLARLSQTAESYVKAENDKYLDKWWNALSIAMDHLSQDQDYLSDVLEHDICYNLHRVYEEHSHLEKQLTSEGNKHLSKMKEAQGIYESRTRERDRIREKVNVCLDKVSQSSAIPSSLSSEASKMSQKLAQSESVLQDAVSRFAIAQQEFNEKMPRILGDFRLMTANSTSTMRELLMKLADIITTTHNKSNQVMHRLKMDLASSTIVKQEEIHLYDPTLKDVLESIAQGHTQQLDMAQESAAGLAASLPTRIPNMPGQFSRAVGKETCVWFNAFSGRMYRDTARSEFFHQWFYEKVAKMLNKGARPGFVDDFAVSDVVFGSIPPLLCNMQWHPAVASDNMDPEYDIACLADMTFRSGLQFTVSTRVWLNWPMDRFAFIPIVIKLEVSELSGKIRFGVRKRKSFLSFVGEPYSRFTVHSEVGSQYKVKNLPKLSSFIIKKIKSHIRKKLIYPNSYEFRLVWPKNWWPGGPDGDAKTPSQQSALKTPEKSLASNHTSISSEKKTSSIRIPGLADGIELLSATTSNVLSSSHTTDDHDAWNSPEKGIRSTVRNTLGRWFQRSKGSRDADAGNKDHNPEDYEEKWKNIFESTMRNISHSSAHRDSYDNLFDVAETIRSCVSTTELVRKRNEYPHLKDIFAPLQPAEVTTELQICASMARTRPRAHSLSDFRTSSLSNLFTELFTERDSPDTQSNVNNSTHSHASLQERSLDDMEVEARSKLGWLKRLRQTQGKQIQNRFLDLKSKIALRIAAADTRVRKASTVILQQNNAQADDQTRGRSQSALMNNGNRPESSATGQVTQPGISNQSNRKLNMSNSLDHNGNGNGNIGSSSGSGAATSLDRSSQSLSAISGHSSSTPAAISASTSTVEKSQAREIARNTFFKFGQKILEAKQSLKNEITKTVERRKKKTSMLSKTMSCVSYQPEDNEMDDSGNSGDENELFGKHLRDSDSSHGNSKDVGTLTRKDSFRESQKPVQKDPEQEAMTLAWQARAQAITLAAEDGQQPSMQGFLRTPQRASPKMWVVLRAGSLAIYSDPASCQSGTPKITYTLVDCICRPLDQAICFELGISDGHKGRNWLSFWAESDVQCKAWVMAVQHSANIH